MSIFGHFFIETPFEIFIGVQTQNTFLLFRVKKKRLNATTPKLYSSLDSNNLCNLDKYKAGRTPF